SDDPSTWEGDGSTIIWEASASDISLDTNAGVRSSDHWWQRMKVTVDTSNLEQGATYYFIVRHNTACGFGRLYADVVFEFTTDVTARRTWSGDLTRAGYGREQGHGGIIFGILDPDPRGITTDLTAWDQCFSNRVADEMVPDESGVVCFTIHSGGSGSNWHSLANWTSYANHMNVYDANPLASGEFNIDDLEPVASYEAGTLALDNAVAGVDLPTTDGVRLSVSGLSPGGVYYLVFGWRIQIANSTHPLTKPIVVEFKVADVRPWDVSSAGDGSLVADVVAGGGSGRVLEISGTGLMRDFTSSSDVPWSWYADNIDSVDVADGVESLGAYALAGLGNPSLKMIGLPATISRISSSAFAANGSLAALDLTACGSDVEYDAGALALPQGATVYVNNAAQAKALVESNALDAQTTCVAVVSDGLLPDASTLMAGELATLNKHQYRFTGWYADAACTQPATWQAIGSDGSGVRYAGWQWSPSDLTALDAAIERAQGSLAGTFESVDGRDVPDTRTWANPSAFELLRSALATARAQDDESYQEVIDAALEALVNAQASFDAARSTVLVDRYPLRFAIARATGVVAGAQVSLDGNDVSENDSWVTQAMADELATAIAEAKQVAEAPDATIADVDAAARRLTSAQDRFLAAKQAGNKRAGAASWHRLAGDIALDTMAAIVDEGFQTCDVAVVATSSGYWDALAASALAGAYDAPVLLTAPDGLSAQTRGQLARLGVSRVYLVGGTAAVSAQVEKDIRNMGVSVTRLWGEMAPDTACAIAAAVGSAAGDTCVVATSSGYWDALSASPYAYANCAPVFLTDGSGVLSPNTLAAIQAGGYSHVVIAGGTAVVPDETLKTLKAMGLSVERLAGDDAYGTSVAFAKWELSHGMGIDGIGVATAGGYWDALCGAALCGSRGSVLVLVDGDRLDAVNKVIAPVGGFVRNGYVFGGTAAVPDSVMAACREATR
ncbi:MAG: cell wall-binding repeat-containing protein, partial [Eggerthellaceae bacterium]|nr:cell wall-binding repeat-containing protein [Eggerthellaceae bacterium]